MNLRNKGAICKKSYMCIHNTTQRDKVQQHCCTPHHATSHRDARNTRHVKRCTVIRHVVNSALHFVNRSRVSRAFMCNTLQDGWRHREAAALGESRFKGRIYPIQQGWVVSDILMMPLFGEGKGFHYVTVRYLGYQRTSSIRYIVYIFQPGWSHLEYQRRLMPSAHPQKLWNLSSSS